MIQQSGGSLRIADLVKKRLGFSLVLALFCLAPALAAQTSQPGVLRLPWSEWVLHRGDQPACAQIETADCPTEPIRINEGNQLNSWERTDIALPAELQKVPELGLLVQGQQPIYEVFVNGRQIGGSGNLARRTGPEYARIILRFPASLARGGRLIIAIHQLGVQPTLPIGNFVPALATPDRLETVRDLDSLAYLRASWLHYLCYAAMFGAGLVFFLLFSVNTRLHEYFWLGARLSTLALFRVMEISWVVNLGLPASWIFTADRVLNALAPLFLVGFVFSFLGKPIPRLFRAIPMVGGLSAITLVLLLPIPTPVFFVLARILEGRLFERVTVEFTTLLADLCLLLLLPTCFRNPRTEMRWIGAAVLFITFIESNRVLGHLGVPTLPQDFMWGNLDFDMRPIAFLLFAVVMLIAMTFRLRRIQDRNRQVELEIEAARGVQQILIPDRLPSIPGLRVESAYLPAQEVGGDFFQILPIAGDPQKPSAWIVLGDVSGKGLKAAMTVSMIVGMLRAYADTCTSPAELLAALNRRLYGRSDGFTTCLALLIEPSGRVTVANAGHPNPYLDGFEIATDPGLPLGIAFDAAFSQIHLQLDVQQTCTLVTDGVVEATDAVTRELFGFERTRHISNQPASSIAEAARAFGQGAPQADDITVLTLTRTLCSEEALV